MISLDSFVYRNGITWEYLIWGTSILLGTIIVYTGAVMYYARLSAKAGIRKKDLPKMVKKQVGRVMEENKKLKAQIKALLIDNRNMSDDLAVLDRFYAKRKGE